MVVNEVENVIVCNDVHAWKAFSRDRQNKMRQNKIDVIYNILYLFYIKIMLLNESFYFFLFFEQFFTPFLKKTLLIFTILYRNVIFLF